MGEKDGKTEQPTPKKLQDARKKGQVAKSADFAPWLALVIGTYVMPYSIGAVTTGVLRTFESLDKVAAEGEPTAVPAILARGLLDGVLGIAPLLVVGALAVTLGLLAQVGVLFTLHPLKPDFKKISPIKGFKRLFSIKSVWETVKQAAKVGLIAYLAWPYVNNMTFGLVTDGRMPVAMAARIVADNMLQMIRLVGWLVVAISAADYMFQKRQRIRDLRMSRQEVRDEYKNTEGNPHVKSRLRSLQLAAARNRMMADVPTADVIVTNPTHVAVALKYDMAAGGAPKVVAIGADAVAQRIRAIGAEAGVPMVEAPPLARALWRACEVGDEIPALLYEAVAKVLVFVKRVKSGIASRSVLPLPAAYQVDTAVFSEIGRRRQRNRRPRAA